MKVLNFIFGLLSVIGAFYCIFLSGTYFSQQWLDSNNFTRNVGYMFCY